MEKRKSISERRKKSEYLGIDIAKLNQAMLLTYHEAHIQTIFDKHAACSLPCAKSSYDKYRKNKYIRKTDLQNIVDGLNSQIKSEGLEKQYKIEDFIDEQWSIQVHNKFARIKELRTASREIRRKVEKLLQKEDPYINAALLKTIDRLEEYAKTSPFSSIPEDNIVWWNLDEEDCRDAHKYGHNLQGEISKENHEFGVTIELPECVLRDLDFRDHENGLLTYWLTTTISRDEQSKIQWEDELREMLYEAICEDLEDQRNEKNDYLVDAFEAWLDDRIISLGWSLTEAQVVDEEPIEIAKRVLAQRMQQEKERKLFSEHNSLSDLLV